MRENTPQRSTRPRIESLPDMDTALRREVGYLRCLVAVLADRLGGTVTFSPDEVHAATRWTVEATESPAFGTMTTLRINKS